MKQERQSTRACLSFRHDAQQASLDAAAQPICFPSSCSEPENFPGSSHATPLRPGQRSLVQALQKPSPPCRPVLAGTRRAPASLSGHVSGRRRPERPPSHVPSLARIRLDQLFGRPRPRPRLSPATAPPEPPPRPAPQQLSPKPPGCFPGRPALRHASLWSPPRSWAALAAHRQKKSHGFVPLLCLPSFAQELPSSQSRPFLPRSSSAAQAAGSPFCSPISRPFRLILSESLPCSPPPPSVCLSRDHPPFHAPARVSCVSAASEESADRRGGEERSGQHLGLPPLAHPGPPTRNQIQWKAARRRHLACIGQGIAETDTLAEAKELFVFVEERQRS